MQLMNSLDSWAILQLMVRDILELILVLLLIVAVNIDGAIFATNWELAEVKGRDTFDRANAKFIKRKFKDTSAFVFFNLF